MSKLYHVSPKTFNYTSKEIEKFGFPMIFLKFNIPNLHKILDFPLFHDVALTLGQNSSNIQAKSLKVKLAI